MDNAKLTVGWRELVAFPEWKIRRVRAKVDTGARTSALHVDDIELLDDNRVRFAVVLSRTDPDKRKIVEADVARESRVRPSTGEQQRRIVVRTPIRIGEVEKEIEISLVSRHNMLCRMLLGRTALADDFLVDVSGKYLLSKPPKSKTTR